jgi:PsbP-like protein
MSILLLTLSYKTQQVLGQSKDTTTSNFLTYTNTDYGFTLKYPPDWIVVDVTNKTSSLTGVKFTSRDGIGNVIVSKFNLRPNETGMSIDDLAKGIISHNLPESKIIELNSNTYFLSGRPAIRTIEIRMNESPMPQVKMMSFVTTSGQNMYTVVYGSISEKFPDYLQTVQPMMIHFK